MSYFDSYEVDTFLAHYGVKGMKWGVRNNSDTSSSSSTSKGDKAAQKAELKAKAAVAGRTALKTAIGPAMVAAGVAGPVALAVGLGVRTLDTPAVQDAIFAGKDYTNAVLGDVGKTAMSTVTQARSELREVLYSLPSKKTYR